MSMSNSPEDTATPDTEQTDTGELSEDDIPEIPEEELQSDITEAVSSVNAVADAVGDEYPTEGWGPVVDMIGQPDEDDEVFGDVEIKRDTVSAEDFVEAEHVLSYSLPPIDGVEDPRDAGIAKAHILRSAEHGYLYYLDEPVLSNEEYQSLLELERLIKNRRSRGEYSDDNMLRERADKDDIERLAWDEVNEMGGIVDKLPQGILKYLDNLAGWTHDDEATTRIIYYLKKKLGGIDKLDPLTLDPHIEDIHLNDANIPIFVNYSHDEIDENMLMTNVVFDGGELTEILKRLAEMADASLSTTNPTAQGALPDGSRIQIVREEAMSHGSIGSTVIRLFNDEPWTTVNLAAPDIHTMSPEMAAYFWLAVENGHSVMFAGGTGSGKTTSTNAVSMFIKPKRKVVTIEDTPEMSLRHLNWSPKLTNKQAGIGFYNLLEVALRERPDYIVLGEVRGEDGASTLFQAMASDHPGLTTFHAEDFDSVVSRMTGDDIGVEESKMAALDIVAMQEQFDDGRRRISSLHELKRVDDNGDLIKEQVLEYDPYEDEFTLNLDDSAVMESVKMNKAWRDERLQEEYQNRVTIIKQMIEEDFDEDDYTLTTDTFQAYMRDEKAKEEITKAAQEGNIREVAERFHQSR